MKRVRTIEQLQRLAAGKRAVKYQNWWRPIPAVFVLNMTCSVVLRMIGVGLFEYGGKK